MLKILVPVTCMPTPVTWMPTPTSFRQKVVSGIVEDCDEEWDAKTREKERMRALVALPGVLLDAIPVLRYLAVADMALHPSLVDDPSFESERAASDCAREDVVQEWDDFRQISSIRKRRWWKIVVESGQRTLVEISKDEGECAQRVAEDHGYETIAQVEGEYASRCHPTCRLTFSTEALAATRFTSASRSASNATTSSLKGPPSLPA